MSREIIHARVMAATIGYDIDDVSNVLAENLVVCICQGTDSVEEADQAIDRLAIEIKRSVRRSWTEARTSGLHS